MEFTYTLIEKATGNFSDFVGEGGFGRVYRASIRYPVNGSVHSVNGSIDCAVKKLKHEGTIAEDDWRKEIEVLKPLSHSCLVKFHGYSSEGGNRCLVYEFVTKGTLKKHLHDERSMGNPLTWAKRVKIAHQISLGVQYLHDNNVIHRDLKGSNILMDDDYNVKIADFGVVKLLNDDASIATTRCLGTRGYLDPEYVKEGKVRLSSDIFSLGVILLELLTGRPSTWKGNRKRTEHLSKWALENIGDNFNLQDVIGSQIFNEIDSEGKVVGVKKFTKLAKQCVARTSDGRPLIGDVVATLCLIHNSHL